VIEPLTIMVVLLAFRDTSEVLVSWKSTIGIGLAGIGVAATRSMLAPSHIAPGALTRGRGV
jgi:hypothetical protein